MLDALIQTSLEIVTITVSYIVNSRGLLWIQRSKAVFSHYRYEKVLGKTFFSKHEISLAHLTIDR